MQFSKLNVISLASLFIVTMLTIFIGTEFWLRFFWCASLVLFYCIYCQYAPKRERMMELLFLFLFLGNFFTIFYETWYFEELALLSFSGAYASLFMFLYKHRGAHSIDKSFKPFFIGAFVINIILVVSLLYLFSDYFENIFLLPVFIIYFIVLIGLLGVSFLHFNSVATKNSFYLLLFVMSLALSDVLRFIDYYYYPSVTVKVCALFAFSFGFLMGYKRMTKVYKRKTKKNFVDFHDVIGVLDK